MYVVWKTSQSLEGRCTKGDKEIQSVEAVGMKPHLEAVNDECHIDLTPKSGNFELGYFTLPRGKMRN